MAEFKKNIKKFSSLLKAAYGVNFARARKILALNGLNLCTNQKQINLEQSVHFCNLEKNKAISNITKYKKIKNYRGIRHMLRLPVRGQRTHTNANTIKKYNA
jgi:small subunit ribosomal protein S13